MKSKIILTSLTFLAVILSVGLANAIDLSIENYYPMPVEAGDYFNVWLKVANRGDNAAENCVVRFKQAYPFSLDKGEEGEKLISKLDPKSAVTKNFKIRVDKQAKEGDNSLVFEYKDCANCIWKEISMPITVIEFQTAFDVVLQELSSEGVFIAVANIGKNPANAITISIPEQEYFKVDLISSTIVGNLDSGDYTIAAFKILPSQKSINEKKELAVQIDYTDVFGVRRTITKQLLLNPSALDRVGMSATGTQDGTRTVKKSSFSSDIWFWAFIVSLAFIVLRKWVFKARKKKA